MKFHMICESLEILGKNMFSDFFFLYRSQFPNLIALCVYPTYHCYQTSIILGFKVVASIPWEYKSRKYTSHVLLCVINIQFGLSSSFEQITKSGWRRKRPSVDDTSLSYLGSTQTYHTSFPPQFCFLSTNVWILVPRAVE